MPFVFGLLVMLLNTPPLACGAQLMGEAPGVMHALPQAVTLQQVCDGDGPAAMTWTRAGAGAPVVIASCHSNDEPQVIHLQKAFGGEAGAGAMTWTSDDGGQVVVVAGDSDDKPRAVFMRPPLLGGERQIAPLGARWIGVRVSPIPEPLAAHIGDKGVMIVNVVKGSPADESGLERYDVVLELNRQDTNSMEGLVQAIRPVPVGEAVRVKVIRGGQSQTLRIAPVERPESAEFEYKYEEPAAEMMEQELNLRGMRLQQGPEGNWLLEELGPLQGIPGVLKELEGLKLRQFDPEDLDLEFEFDTEDFEGGMPLFEWHGDGEGDAKIELKLQIDDDGKVTTIHRSGDGSIRVERTTPEGDHTQTTYDNMDALRKDDPEAFRMLNRHSGGKRLGVIRQHPQQMRLRKLQDEFQVDVEKKIERALERSRKALDEARAAEERARMEMRRLERQTDRESTRERRGDEERSERSKARRGAEARVLSIEIADDGQITVTERRNGDRTVHRFSDKESFEREAPDLYKKFRSMFD